MNIRRICDFDELADFAGEWNQLAGGVPFRTIEWLGTWWRHYRPAFLSEGRDVELYVICVFDIDELIGIAPWYIERSLAGGCIVRFLGSGEVCSDYLTVFSRPDRQVDVAEGISDWLTCSGGASAASDDRWDILELSGVEASEPMPSLLAERLHNHGAVVHSQHIHNTWRIELPGTLEEYLGMLSKSHRKQIRQLQRRLFDTGLAVLRTVEQPQHLEIGWKLLSDLHQRRLESLGKPGCFQSQTFAAFHRAATDALFRAGRLRLHWLELDERPVAAEYHLAGDKIVFAYQGGIEPDALPSEPGRLATLATIERAIADGFSAFDFCRGDEPYKQHWRAQPRVNVTWRIVCNRSSARLRNSMWIAGQNVRRWLRRNRNESASKLATAGEEAVGS